MRRHAVVQAPSLERQSAKLADGYFDLLGGGVVRPFDLNKNVLPSTLDEHISYVKEWERRCGMPTIAYEYHYCINQWYEPGAIKFSKLVYDDVRGYHANGIRGVIEDASQRTFFPNGFCFYIYATTLFDTSIDFDAAVEDYYSHAYGGE